MTVARKNQHARSPVKTRDASSDAPSIQIQTTASGTQYVPSTVALFSREKLDGLIEAVKAKRKTAK